MAGAAGAFRYGTIVIVALISGPWTKQTIE